MSVEPIFVCSWCKRVKCADGVYRQPGTGDVDNSQISTSAGDQLMGLKSHGICPECNEKWRKQAGVKEGK